MNWTKVKVILIILFLIINMILAGILINRSYNTADSLSVDITEILRARNITVAPHLVKTAGGTAKISDACPITSESSEFLKNLKTTAQLTEDGTYVTDSFKVSVYGDFVHIEVLKSSFSSAEQLFDALGLDFSSAIYEGKTENETVYHYIEGYENHGIFGTMADVTITENTVKSADIAWYELSGKHEQFLETISFADALLNFASDKARGTQGCTVSEITFGYSVDAEDVAASASQMIPCIRITTDIGSSFYYDARRPEQ